MTRRYARWVALMLLLGVLGGCGGTAENEFNKGKEFAEREDWDTAIACYTEAIRLKPDFAVAYYIRGVSYADKGETDKAIEDYTEAIRLQIRLEFAADAYNYRGIAYRKKDDQAKADADFAKYEELKAKK